MVCAVGNFSNYSQFWKQILMKFSRQENKVHRHQRIKWRHGVKGTVEQFHDDRQIYEWSGSGFMQSISPLWPSKRERKQKTKPTTANAMKLKATRTQYYSSNWTNLTIRWGMELCPFTYIPFRHNEGGNNLSESYFTASYLP